MIGCRLLSVSEQFSKNFLAADGEKVVQSEDCHVAGETRPGQGRSRLSTGQQREESRQHQHGGHQHEGEVRDDLRERGESERCNYCRMKEAKGRGAGPGGLGDHHEDLASTTTGLDLESVMALQTDLTSDEELSTTIDLSDAQAIRKQLDGLENMYTEVLKLLGNIFLSKKN